MEFLFWAALGGGLLTYGIIQRGQHAEMRVAGKVNPYEGTEWLSIGLGALFLLGAFFS